LRCGITSTNEIKIHICIFQLLSYLELIFGFYIYQSLDHFQRGDDVADNDFGIQETNSDNGQSITVGFMSTEYTCHLLTSGMVSQEDLVVHLRSLAAAGLFITLIHCHIHYLTS